MTLLVASTSAVTLRPDAKKPSRTASWTSMWPTLPRVMTARIITAMRSDSPQHFGLPSWRRRLSWQRAPREVTQRANTAAECACAAYARTSSMV